MLEEHTNLGIDSLDTALGGGVLKNAIILIAFEPGTKEWVFGAEIIRKALLNGDYVIHIDFDHGPDYYLSSFLGLNVENKQIQEKLKNAYQSGRLKLIDCFTTEASTDEAKKDLDNYFIVDNPYNLSKLLFKMKQVRDLISSDAPVKWVFSNITSLSINLEIQDVVRFCRSAFRFHKQYDDLALYYVNKNAHSNQFLSLIYQLVDVIIELKVKETNNRTVTLLKVVKNAFMYPIPSEIIYRIENGKVNINLLVK
ncbi:MAG: RAD55 family ATPase [Candidatus Odinarchaeia archaeon]